MSFFVPKDRISLFRQFLAGLYDAVVIAGPSGHILACNARTGDHFGCSEEGLFDQPVSQIVRRLTAEAVQCIRRVFEGDRHVIGDANGRKIVGVVGSILKS